MPMVPAGVARETEIAEAVAEVERSLTPDVVHIRYEIGTDWSGDWAVFFRVLLSDEAGALAQKAGKVLGEDYTRPPQ